jgi:hypothetical protein
MTKTDTELLAQITTALDEITYSTDDDSVWVDSGYNRVSVIEISNGVLYSGYGYYDNTCNHWDVQTSSNVADVAEAIEYLVNESRGGE